MSKKQYVFYEDVEEEVESDAVKGGSYTKEHTGVFWKAKRISPDVAEQICEKYGVRKQEVEFDVARLNIDQDGPYNYSWKLSEEDENKLFQAVCDRYSFSYGHEHKEYFDYQPHPDPEYDYKIRVRKWTAHKAKVHIGKARWDENEKRWVVAYENSSRWHG